MNKFKKVVVGATLALGLALGGASAGSVVTASPAEAYSGSYDYYKCGNGSLLYYKYINYSWWEEVYYGKRDGNVLVAVERSSWCPYTPIRTVGR